ncbi:MFS transporter, partial [Salmonella enterica]|uniref:MFS transporter n=1 Tax=Salmonella enterica TaxID=28901 RepID=UPI00373635B6
MGNVVLSVRWRRDSVPDHERARATAIYSSAQYIGLALLTPALAFIVANYGWEMSFYLSGGAGIL